MTSSAAVEPTFSSRWARSIRSKWLRSIIRNQEAGIALSRADSSSKGRKSKATTDEKIKKEKNYEVTDFGSF